jgi:hypothetical protein
VIGVVVGALFLGQCREAGSDAVDIHVKKVRFKASGSVGTVRLHYDRVTGEYREPLPPAPRWMADND